MSTDSTIELHVGDEVVVVGDGHHGYNGEVLAVEPGDSYLVQLARYQLRFGRDDLRPARASDVKHREDPSMSTETDARAEGWRLARARTGAFRYVGTTDETTECEHCGRTDLRSTVVLALLDHDGSTDEYVRYGSTCAARALCISGGGRHVAKVAEIHRHLTFEAARVARVALARYAGPDAVDLFRADFATMAERTDRFVAHKLRRRIDEWTTTVRDADQLTG